MVSGPSPFDRYMAGERSAMNPAAVRGMRLFNGKGHCTPCHSGPLFSNQDFHNLGVGMDKEKPDLGRFDHTKNPADKGKFKVPTLRNIAQTPPYLHDGSAKTLMDVIEVYDHGGVPNPWLDPLVVPLQLTQREKQDLVAFLEALTGPVAEGRGAEVPRRSGRPGRSAGRSAMNSRTLVSLLLLVLVAASGSWPRRLPPSRSSPASTASSARCATRTFRG